MSTSRGAFVGIELAAVDQAHEGVAVALGQEELVARLDALDLVLLLEQVVLDELAGRLLAPSPSASSAREAQQEERDRRQALLAVDDLDRVGAR